MLSYCEFVYLFSKIRVSVIFHYYLLKCQCCLLQRYIYVADVSDKNIHVMKIHDNWDLTQLKVTGPWFPIQHVPLAPKLDLGMYFLNEGNETILEE